MKQEANNEIDLLLRKLGRQFSDAPEGSDSVVSEESHLDADELNMFAENVLPATARARCTEHLIDCSRCRQLVSQLSIATGRVVELEKKVETPSPSGLRNFFASLMTPMVLRYAVPALSLAIVATVGFFVLRDSGSSNVATMNQESARPVQSVAPGLLSSPQESPSMKSDAVAKATAPANEVKEQQPTAAQEPNKNAAPVQKTDESARDAVSKTSNEVVYAPPPGAGAVAPTSPKIASENKAKSADDTAEKRQAEEPARADVAIAKPQPKEEDQRKDGGAEATRSEVARKNSPAGRVQPRARAAEAEGRDKDSETRSVGGRHFRREGSVWIDVDYNSQATTNVSRNSEQYRALIADEPGIRSIADQLGGEVILMWKGRAYRIR